MENVNLNKALNEAGELIKNKLKVAASNDGFKATGKLDKSFDYSVVANQLQIMSEKYAEALSEGVSKGNGNRDAFNKKMINIEEWASKKGIVPRDKNGKFVKRTKSAIRNMVFGISVSIGKKGISKRFGYEGSGFIQEVKNSMEKKITNIIEEGYKKDLLIELDRINKTNR